MVLAFGRDLGAGPFGRALRDERVHPFAKVAAVVAHRDEIVILAGGTGNQYFTTDTTAALRAMELKAEILMKATKVSGVYDSDPVKNPNAIKYDTLSYMKVLQDRLNVMDTTAISLCMDNNLPIMVFSVKEPGNIRKAVMGENIGTIVTA